jgi:hypothetical protein
MLLEGFVEAARFVGGQLLGPSKNIRNTAGICNAKIGATNAEEGASPARLEKRLKRKVHDKGRMKAMLPSAFSHFYCPIGSLHLFLSGGRKQTVHS